MDDKLPIILKKIYSKLGAGYKEHIYQKAIEIELQREFIAFHSEVICPILYDNIQLGFERADIVIYEENKPYCIFELKSQTTCVTKKEFIQLHKYLDNLNISTGYLINFLINLDKINFKNIELFKVEKNEFKITKYSFLLNVFNDYKLC